MVHIFPGGLGYIFYIHTFCGYIPYLYFILLLFPPKLAKCIPIISPAVYMQIIFQYLTIIYRHSVCVMDTFDAKKKAIIQNWNRIISIDTFLEKKLLGLALQKTFGKCLESFKKIAKGDGKTFAQKTRSQ